MNENKKIRILLVDDDENIRTMYAEIFVAAGFSVEEALDGADGLAKAVKNIPDLIFTGIDMPRMNGFAMIEALRKDPATAGIPIIMSSHRGRKEDETRAREMGVKDFIIFGMITPRQITERIKSMFHGNVYLLKFNSEQLDALKLASDLNIKKDYSCQKCGGDLLLSLKKSSPGQGYLSANFVCPVCK
jgi:two-component system, chemotaxis family, chemotaxis protein CheY